MKRTSTALIIGAAAVLLVGCAAPAPSVSPRDALVDAISEIDGVLAGGDAFNLDFNIATGRAQLSVPISADSWDEFSDITVKIVDAWTDSSFADERPLFLTLSTSGGYSHFLWANVDTNNLDPYLAATKIWYDLDAAESPTLTSGGATNFIRDDEFGIHVNVTSEDLIESTVASIEQRVTDAGLTFRPGGITADDD